MRVIGIHEATYYARRQRLQREPKERAYNGGRPQPGYSWTQDGKRISDEQIKEYLRGRLENKQIPSQPLQKHDFLIQTAKNQSLFIGLTSPF
ncbi:hypothetical protein HM1_0154 [Heliomicrobium modesticaldum Ice1]|uniref:Uncharacterized protein n=1 Tax=Heliobacterium modesticaldum (strain ATCC 51547 / Ice1) TaxID=498761 RepID=B0TDR0_HELMI|nr:hypothetical protein HM1_0154 [Heliomicrobium modesticaldum Ice1]